MITQSFLASQEYQQFKEVLNSELFMRPMNIKTEGKSNETIAREVTAHEFAVKIVEKAIRRFERQAMGETKKEVNWK